MKTWAFRWEVACFAQNGLFVAPEASLITNVGFGAGATHTRRHHPVFAGVKAHPLRLPLRHPPFVYADGDPERSVEREIHRCLSLKSRWAQRFRQIVGMIEDYGEVTPW